MIPCVVLWLDWFALLCICGSLAAVSDFCFELFVLIYCLVDSLGFVYIDGASFWVWIWLVFFGFWFWDCFVLG